MSAITLSPGENRTPSISTGLYDLANRILAQPRVLSNSIVLGFPYSDVREMGSAAIVVADGDQTLADRLARELAGYIWEHRSEFVGVLRRGAARYDEAWAEAGREEGPICLLDMGDNIGGASAADGTFLAHAIHLARLPGSFVCLDDVESASAARQAGVGARVHLGMGGKADDLHGPPVEALVTVVSLHDGRLTESQPRHGGRTHFDMAATAVVRTDEGMTIMLTSRRQPPGQPGAAVVAGKRVLVEKPMSRPFARRSVAT